MTQEEFENLMSSYGFSIEDHSVYMSVDISSRYGKPMRFIEYRKTDGAEIYVGDYRKGEVYVYNIRPISTIDGYIVNYEVKACCDWKCFSKVHKLKRFLDEQLKLLKDMKVKIKETEISWDFSDEE